jgi:hypothetical protein
VSISESSITNDVTSSAFYAFMEISDNSSVILASVMVSDLSLSGSPSTLINVLGSSWISIIGCTFSNINSAGTSGAILTDDNNLVDKAVHLVMNGTLFTGISVPGATTGIVLTVVGGMGTNVIVHNSSFASDISSSLSSITLGGGIYVGTTSLLEVDKSIFSGISNVGSGGGIYISVNGSVLISDTLFDNITVVNSGGFPHFYFFFCLIYFRWCFI